MNLRHTKRKEEDKDGELRDYNGESGSPVKSEKNGGGRDQLSWSREKKWGLMRPTILSNLSMGPFRVQLNLRKHCHPNRKTDEGD